MNKILAVSDLHVLSNYGLSLETYQGEDGVIYKASKGQLRLLSYWKHLCHTVKTEKKWKIDELWVVGDVFAGTNPVERGRKTRGTLDEQLRVATELLKMMPKVTVKVWSGTAYHESMDTLMHQRLVENLRLEGYDAHFRGDWSFERIGKTTAFVSHHASSAVVYPHTPMVRDSRWFKIQYADGKLPKVDWIIRADKHQSLFVDDRSVYIIQLPCWQAFTPYKKSLKMFPAWQPDYGGVFLWTDDVGRRRYQEWLYPPFLIAPNGDIIETQYNKARYVDWKPNWHSTHHDDQEVAPA